MSGALLRQAAATFTARYDGYCRICNAAIYEGNLIAYVDDEIACDRCAFTADDDEPDPCPVCWLVHPEGACDR